MKNMKQTIGALFGLGMSVLTLANHASAEEHIAVLIDQSGSMLDDSVNQVIPRYVVARELAMDDLSAARASDTEYALYTFNGSSFSNVVPFTNNVDLVKGALWDLPDPTSSTPLAGSICAVVQALIEHKVGINAIKRIELYSDGLENSTPHTNECWGPNSADHANPDIGSWEWKVFNKARSGNPLNSALIDPPLIINASFLFENEPAFILPSIAAPSPSPIAPSPVPAISEFAIAPTRGTAAATSSQDWVDRLRISIPSPLIRSQKLEGVAPTSAILNSPALELTRTKNFFKALTLAPKNAGRYREFSTKTKRLPQLGDVTGDYCVDSADTAAVQAHFGEKVAPGSPFDPNQDHVVNFFDYVTVTQNFGQGCRTH